MSEAKEKEHLETIRNIFLNTTFQHYQTLISYLKSLPIPQQIPLLHKAYLDFDTAIILFKEILTTCPIILPKKNEQEKQSEEPKENQQELREESTAVEDNCK
jgi:hypothetical protein